MNSSSGLGPGPAARCAGTVSLWQQNAAARSTSPALVGDHATDVLVIGGGVAGLSAALHLAEAGVDVILLEAETIGSGATGQSGGLIAPDFIRHSPASIEAMLGAEAGRRLVGLMATSAERCFDLVARHDIACDARQDGFWSPAHTPALVAAQQDYAKQWQARGFDVDFIAQADTAAALGARGYLGALRFAHGGSLDPLALAIGLAKAAVGAGAQLFAGSKVSGLVHSSTGWRASTSQGVVSARRLVLAANGGNPHLHPALRNTILPLRVVEFATEPLSAAERQSILPDGGSFTDKKPYVFTARYDGAGRLISAFARTFIERGEKASLAEARRRLTRAFAGLTAPVISHLWEGTAWINTSFLPEIYDLGDDALAIQACNGRGLSTNVAIGREVAQALVAGDLAELSVAPRRPVPIRMHAGAMVLPKLLMSLGRLSN